MISSLEEVPHHHLGGLHNHQHVKDKYKGFITTNVWAIDLLKNH